MAQHGQPFALRNIRLFIAFRIFFNARFYYPVFTILFLDYGLTIEQFALLNTVWAISIVMAEVPSGALADIVGRKKLIVATSLLMLLELGLIAVVPLANISLVFWAFFANRILSGLAEAMASGADEAIAYDSLAEQGLQETWPQVLSLQMRLKSIASIITATTGALVYDPDIVNRMFALLGMGVEVSQQQSMRYPVYLTLCLAVLATLTAFMFQEDRKPAFAGQAGGFIKNMGGALRLTLTTGQWILKTPFAMAVIVFGMYYDHLLRMIITMTSQYFRLISLPEASFGVISAMLSMLGLYIPKLCESMAANNTPGKNLLLILAVSVAGLVGLTGFVPYFGLLPMALVYTGIVMVSFFTSHYLNRITASDKRATVLSFKGMAFNLAYGLIGVLFAVLMQQLRSEKQTVNPEWSAKMVEDSSFIAAIGWFPWYGIILFLLFAFYFRSSLRENNECQLRG